MVRWLIVCAALLLGCGSGWAQDEGERSVDRLFVAGQNGIYAFEMEPETGVLRPPVLAAELASPSFLATHPSGWFLFATSNDGDRATRSSSHLVSYFIEPSTGLLHELSRRETGGTTSAYVEVDPLRSAVLVANYRWGSVAGFPLGVDGKLGKRALWIEHEGSSVILPRQSEPHPHAVRVSPDGNHLYVPDLGTDEVFIYQYEADGTVRPAPVRAAKVEEGDGPRHLDFHPELPVVYLLNEISSRITMFRRDPENGALTAYQSISLLPSGYEGGNSGAEVRVHPSGKFVYASNRGHDSIAVFRTDREGFLSLVEHQKTGGETPRHFTLHPSGRWLIVGNQGSGTVAVFAVDEAEGTLEPKGDPRWVNRPACLVFAPSP